MRKWVLSAVFFVSVSAPAIAGFQQWSVNTEDDPFSGGKRVTVDFMSSIRSGVIVICDTAETGLMFRAIPGFTFDTRLQGLTPEIEFAIDGVKLLGQTGETGAVGDNLAAAQVMLTKENAESLVAAFATAKKQIAIKDGISDRPHLLTARGSTKASASLLACMKTQK